MIKICKNIICENRSRRFEKKYCCIECADFDDGIISLHEWLCICEKKLYAK